MTGAERGPTAHDWVAQADYYNASLSAATPLCILVFADHGPLPPAAHFHAGLQVTVVLGGEIEDYCSDAVIRCARGDAYLCRMWEPHGWRDATAGITNITLIFLPEFLGDQALSDVHWPDLFSAPAPLRPRVVRPEMRARMAVLGEELLAEIEARERGWVSAVRLKMLELLLTLGRSWEAGRAQLTGGEETRAVALPRIMPALNLVHAGAGRRTSLEQAAAACSLSRTHFQRLFQHTMGTSFGRFLLQSRLSSAARLLVSTPSPVEAVAWETGFADGSHLHRAFVREYGCTPGQYRARRAAPRAGGPRPAGAFSSDLPVRPTLALWPSLSSHDQGRGAATSGGYN
jgi:AraC-like DNA-binding protein